MRGTLADDRRRSCAWEPYSRTRSFQSQKQQRGHSHAPASAAFCCRRPCSRVFTRSLDSPEAWRAHSGSRHAATESERSRLGQVRWFTTLHRRTGALHKWAGTLHKWEHAAGRYAPSAPRPEDAARRFAGRPLATVAAERARMDAGGRPPRPPCRAGA
jgi:hypothetical protein